MIDGARAQKGKSMEEKLSAELLNAAKNEGIALKKKNDMHRMAEANKAFAHFARQR
jgi:small subunit ribosomal protein S7